MGPRRVHALVSAKIHSWRAALLGATSGLAILAGAKRAFAEGSSAFDISHISENQGFIGVSVFVALVLITAVTALLHLTGRNRWTQREASLVGDLTQTRSALDRANFFLTAEQQIIIAWGSASGEPDVEGDLTLVGDALSSRRVLAFGTWLSPRDAQNFETHVDRLRQRGEGFRLSLTSTSGRHLEAEGRAVGGRAVLRIRDVSGLQLELTRLRERYARALTDLETLRAMLDAAPNAVWMRDIDGKLAWVNSAYARAVEASDGHDAVLRGIELLDRATRDAATSARHDSPVWRARVPAVVGNDRRLLDVVELVGASGGAGQAVDLSELETMRAELSREMEAHKRTLDQLPTAVAIFDRQKRLLFHNQAYRQLWSLDSAFLGQKPADSEILDRLRAERRLPEQADFRAWKEALFGAYQSVDTTEQIWYLPDSRNLRVVVTPNPQGGVTYLFDDVTERYNLESRYIALSRAQSETLDSLREGVVVFGSDGKVKLHNRAFADMWMLEPQALSLRPHVDQVLRQCQSLAPDAKIWAEIRGVVAGLTDARTGLEHRLKREDGAAVDLVVAPLPDGGTLLTFTDVSAVVSVEHALTERNNALLAAEKLRNDFVHHVSYELRSPLTNIIGFIQLLSDGSVGELNERQREYIGYVMKSSSALHAIINDILDLATIDLGALELSIDTVDIRKTIEAAAQGLQDRLEEASIQLRIVALDSIGTMRADGKRLRQILFNLLSNAVGFSSPGQTVTLAAMRRDDKIVIKVSDQGRGIPPEIIDRIFDRFQTHTVGTRHRGAGLGLSIVRAFVELHGGEVHVQSAPGEGTVVTCTLPVDAAPQRAVVAV
jgi:signal transduction histidine kinase